MFPKSSTIIAFGRPEPVVVAVLAIAAPRPPLTSRALEDAEAFAVPRGIQWRACYSSAPSPLSLSHPPPPPFFRDSQRSQRACFCVAAFLLSDHLSYRSPRAASQPATTSLPPPVARPLLLSPAILVLIRSCRRCCRCTSAKPGGPRCSRRPRLLGTQCPRSR